MVVMATMTVLIFFTYAYCDQRSYMQRHLRKPADMKKELFTTGLIDLAVGLDLKYVLKK